MIKNYGFKNNTYLEPILRGKLWYPIFYYNPLFVRLRPENPGSNYKFLT